VFLLGAGLMLSLFGASALSVSFLGTAGLSFAFIYRARGQFLPLRQPRAA